MHRLTLLAALGLSTPALAEVTVLGWPGGPEETALRAAAEAYNATEGLAEEDRVELLLTSRDGFFDKLAADLAAGSTAFDATLVSGVEFLGADASVFVALTGRAEVAVRAPGHVRPREGAAVGLAFDAGALHLFDAGGRALR